MGHKVVAVGPGKLEDWKEKFERIGVRYMQVDASRTGMNPFDDYRSYRAIVTLLKNENPDKVFTYMSKTIVLGALAARKAGIEDVYALIGGLGSIIRGTGIKNAILKKGLKALYKKSLKNCKFVFFHNDNDANVLVKDGVVPREKTKVINGSGVNLEKFTPQPFPKQLTFLFAGRLIKDKGIQEYLEACKIVKEEHPEVRCLVVGRYDTNPSGINHRLVKKYIDQGIVEYFDEQDDIRPFITQSSVVVLPSYHEGRPKILLEAMAMGRAIITTDVPGCRDTVDHNYNGLLVGPKDPGVLSTKMKELVLSPNTFILMRKDNRKIAIEKYNVHDINLKIMQAMSLTA